MYSVYYGMKQFSELELIIEFYFKTFFMLKGYLYPCVQFTKEF